jgi:hypothetical protein
MNLLLPNITYLSSCIIIMNILLYDCFEIGPEILEYYRFYPKTKCRYIIFITASWHILKITILCRSFVTSMNLYFCYSLKKIVMNVRSVSVMVTLSVKNCELTLPRQNSLDIPNLTIIEMRGRSTVVLWVAHGIWTFCVYALEQRVVMYSTLLGWHGLH